MGCLTLLLCEYAIVHTANGRDNGTGIALQWYKYWTSLFDKLTLITWISSWFSHNICYVNVYDIIGSAI